MPDNLAQPTSNGVKLGRPWPEVERSRSRLGPNLGLTCAQLGPPGSNLSPTWPNRAASTQMIPKLKPCHAHAGASPTWRNLERFGGGFALNQLGPK